jgi:hypothetical protein
MCECVDWIPLAPDRERLISYKKIRINAVTAYFQALYQNFSKQTNKAKKYFRITRTEFRTRVLFLGIETFMISNHPKILWEDVIKLW